MYLITLQRICNGVGVELEWSGSGVGVEWYSQRTTVQGVAGSIAVTRPIRSSVRRFDNRLSDCGPF